MDQQGQGYPDTGFLEIDVEHRAISQEIEKLLNAINANRLPDIGEVLASLVAKVADHFAHEERLMRDSGYPKLLQHSQAHAIFVRDALGFKNQFDSKGPTLEFRRWATGRLLKWFRLHIMAHDVELGLFLIAKGKAPSELRA